MNTRVLLVGFLEGYNFEVSPFFSDRNLFEFDLVIMDIQNVIRELNIPNQKTQQFHLEFANGRFRNGWYRYEQYLDAGHAIVIVSRYLHAIFTDDFNHNLDLSKKFPFEAGMPNRIRGNSVRLANQFESFKNLEDALPIFEYETALGHSNLEVILETDRPPFHPVGGYFKRATGGYVVYLPPAKDLNQPLKSKNDEGTLEEYVSFTAECVAAIQSLTTVKTAYEFPEWTAECLLPEELSAVNEIEVQKAKIAMAEGEIGKQRETIARQVPWKRLFVSHDDPLVDATIDALRVLGVRAEKGPSKRADILGVYKDTLIVSEVKGKTKGVSESNLRELESWVSEVKFALSAEEEELKGKPVIHQYREILRGIGIQIGEGGIPKDSKISLKAVLVINAFRDMPPNLRPSEIIPHAASLLIEQGSVCVLTGLQLLKTVFGLLPVRLTPS